MNEYTISYCGEYSKHTQAWGLGSMDITAEVVEDTMEDIMGDIMVDITEDIMVDTMEDIMEVTITMEDTVVTLCM